MTRPTYLNQQNADAFLDSEVAARYHLRPHYPDSLIRFLATLAGEPPGNVLDLGCGTGNIARELAPYVSGVVAVDPSDAMLEEARRAPGGNHPAIRWRRQRAEEFDIDETFALIVAGESLHWMQWEIVLPLCARLLHPDGVLAIARLDVAPLPWDAELRDNIARYSVVQDYIPFDMVAALEGEGLFEVRGHYRSPVERQPQSIDDYIESFHARSSLARTRMGEERASQFGRDLRAVVEHYGDTVDRCVTATVVYGRAAG